MVDTWLLKLKLKLDSHLRCYPFDDLFRFDCLSCAILTTSPEDQKATSFTNQSFVIPCS
jgi:hypothetical protein